MEVSFGRKQIPQTDSLFTRNFADLHLNTEPLDLKCALRISIVFCAHAGCWTGVAAPGIKVERFQRRPPCHRSRLESSNGFHCGFTIFLPACRSMTCGPSICRGRALASLWMS